MKRSAKIFLLAAALLGVPQLSAHAAEQMGLPQFLHTVILHHKPVHAELRSLEATYYSVLASVANQRPTLGVNVDGGWVSKQGDESNVTVGSAQLALMHRFDLSGEYSLNERQNILGYEVHRARFDAMLNTLFSSAEQTWWNTVLARENLKLQREILRQRTENHRITMEKYRQELVPKLDVVRSEARVVEAETLVTTSEALYNNMLLRLKYFTGGRDVEPFDEELQVPALEINPDYDEAIETKASLRAARLSVLRAKLVKSLAARAKSPKLSFTAAWTGWSEPEMYATPQDRRVGASLNLSIPILDGNATKYSVLNADRLLQYAEANLEDLKLQTRRDIDMALNEWNTAAAAEANKKRQVERSEEELRITALMYTEGIGAQIDLINAQTDYQAVRTEYLEAVRTMYIALAQLREAIGIYSTDDDGSWQEALEAFGKGREFGAEEEIARHHSRDPRLRALAAQTAAAQAEERDEK